MEAPRPLLRCNRVIHVTRRIKTGLHLAEPPQSLQSVPATDSPQPALLIVPSRIQDATASFSCSDKNFPLWEHIWCQQGTNPPGLCLVGFSEVLWWTEADVRTLQPKPCCLCNMQPACLQTCARVVQISWCHAVCFLTVFSHWDPCWLSQTLRSHLVCTVTRPRSRWVFLENRYKLRPFTLFPNFCNYWETLMPARH